MDTVIIKLILPTIGSVCSIIIAMAFSKYLLSAENKLERSCTKKTHHKKNIFNHICDTVV